MEHKKAIKQGPFIKTTILKILTTSKNLKIINDQKRKEISKIIQINYFMMFQGLIRHHKNTVIPYLNEIYLIEAKKRIK